MPNNKNDSILQSKNFSRSPHEPPRDTRKLLIETAKKIFASKGFKGTTVKAIAEGAHVNISLISYHFSGKEGLYRTCLENFGMKRLESTERILVEPQTLEEFHLRIKLYFEEFFEVFLLEPDLVQIVMRECEMQMPIAEDIFRNTFIREYQKVIRFFQIAQQKKFLRQDLNMEIIGMMIISGFSNIAKKIHLKGRAVWELSKEYSDNKKIISDLLIFCFEGCSLQSQDNNPSNPNGKTDNSLNSRVDLRNFLCSTH